MAYYFRAAYRRARDRSSEQGTMSRGSIQRHGKRSFRIRFENGLDAAGRRKRHTVTFRGSKRDAERELTRLLGSADAGTLPEPSKATVTEHMRDWIKNDPDLSPKTAERYLGLTELQIIPHLGTTPLQKPKPKQIDDWHKTLLKTGAKNGGPLSARTVGHAHRVLHRALQIAVENESKAAGDAYGPGPWQAQ
jgi:hypothetical protein